MVEDGIAVLESTHVRGVVVGRMVVSTADEDALPFEGQRPGDGVVLLAAVLLLLVVGAGPVGVADAFAGMLVEGLADKARAGMATGDHGGQAGADEDRSDAAEALQGASVG